MLTRHIVVSISQYIQISHRYGAYLKLTECCMSVIPQFKKIRDFHFWEKKTRMPPFPYILNGKLSHAIYLNDAFNIGTINRRIAITF